MLCANITDKVKENKANKNECVLYDTFYINQNQAIKHSIRALKNHYFRQDGGNSKWKGTWGWHLSDNLILLVFD